MNKMFSLDAFIYLFIFFTPSCAEYLMHSVLNVLSLLQIRTVMLDHLKGYVVNTGVCW